MEAISAMQVRIAQIQGSLAALAPAPPAGAPTALGGATPTTSSTASTARGSAFADVLATATATTALPRTTPLTASSTGWGAIEPTADRTRFAADLLERLGFTATDENMKALVAWQQAEGTKAAHNPLATTQRSAGATTFNYAGVKNYLDYEQGLAATVTTITNGRYDEVLAALRAGTSATDVADAIARSPWGTGELVSKLLRR